MFAEPGQPAETPAGWLCWFSGGERADAETELPLERKRKRWARQPRMASQALRSTVIWLQHPGASV
jgi:hypothetical protein